ncbi:MAG: ligand-binding protein SH3 [Candidatus Nealsonbacteria bacterium CG_4_9_14_3_um_filter_35_11]|uniref:Ligand-binding protein SH3 n=2 Tax=Candidatus Nealsoniibacteriota TaxID=1817911 RepID=A0A2M7DB88_9BACT|nr:MAG: ligand-binding protein SH3 [Candidatus Nealsonbacteria bacterium CG11_big_fil_rev_8_21_14_0_20_35_11]PIV45667.1 MAG: ligand-binding protein SH3 [Candidatus Nealsonbacteria bacterium CG02_land_8_20_14_3_00_34_20]PIW92809.1 MAG: ligand-binding protein SH3 [Candidatus Nealsonbacteria bacterium CG_4_8_14_3_um_filter_34_13]PIZ90113.1 MAG: ligand-binding protein SH3 [Candidatus Nealsonbacteria bacterium CG_4_10_14_0_2_um_filter_35_20]PJA84431.1 MAG: ligand-binding protein SH3 [Candidatus Neal
MIPEIQTFLIAMSPVLELRGSIPIALVVYKLPVVSAFFLSILGNLIPPIFIILFLEKLSNFLTHRFYFFNRFFSWLFEKTRNSHQDLFQKFKELGLVILVAIPLPFTGAWTGSICAFVFGIPPKRAIPLISLGVFIAGIIVILTTLGIISLI